MGGKKNLQLVCGNVIAEIRGKKKIWQLWQSQCRKWEGKKMLHPQYFHNKLQVIRYY